VGDACLCGEPVTELHGHRHGAATSTKRASADPLSHGRMIHSAYKAASTG
jgi:hypothetical protein